MKKRIEDMKKNNQKAQQTKKLNSQYYEVENIIQIMLDVCL